MYVGIDGCKAGWIVATIDDERQLHLYQIAKLEALQNVAAVVAYIDIPLGFAEGQYRNCEVEAQRLLGPKKRASIFLTPHKDAVYASIYEEANGLNKALIGKGLSKQAWNICPKIREAISFTASQSSLQLREAHPELCFYFLNNQQPVLSKKSSLQGIADRMKIITSISPQYKQAIEEMMNCTKRKDLQMDDVLDATILSIRASSNTPQQVPIISSALDRDVIFF